MSERTSILKRLPELYQRRGGGLLRRYLEVAESLLEDLEASLWAGEGEPPDAPLRPRSAGVERATASPLSGAQALLGEERPRSIAAPGTLGGLAAWLRSRGHDPWIWPALTVCEEPAGRVRFSRTWERAAVIVWTRGRADGLPRRNAFPEDFVPAGCELKGVKLERPPRLCPPPSGFAGRGVILF